jgi:hypothetical protein
VTDWQPPGAAPPPPTPPAAWGQPYPYPQPPQPPYGASGPAPAHLPWYRSTAFLILGGLALLVLGGATGALVTFVAIHAVDTLDETFDTADVTTYGDGGDLTTFGLARGQCATEDVFESHGYGEGDAVACEASHAVEHYASTEPPDLAGEGDAGTFSADDLAAFADAACYLAFEPYVGLAYADSAYDYTAVVPSAEAWDAGTRTVHCVLYEFDGGTSTGSAKLSRR